MVLTLPTFWYFHWNLGLSLTASDSGLSRIQCKDLVTYCLVSDSSEIIEQVSINPSIFILYALKTSMTCMILPSYTASSRCSLPPPTNHSHISFCVLRSCLQITISTALVKLLTKFWMFVMYHIYVLLYIKYFLLLYSSFILLRIYFK